MESIVNKYQPLTDHLKAQKNSNYSIKFKEIEGIIHDNLPPSAYRHRAWWSNNPTNSVMTKAWLDAGWISSDVDMEAQKLVFRRKRQPPPPPGSAPMASRQPEPAIFCIRNLPSSTLANLKARAELAGQTVEDAAREVLEKHAPITITERFALVDRIRSASPNLRHVDIPAMIRKDRDSR